MAQSGNRPQPLAGIILTLLSALLLAGVLSFAGPCAHEDGSVAACSSAARAVVALGVAALVLSIVRIFELDEGERRGLSLGVATLGVLVVLMPGTLVSLCAEESMRCHAVMQPFCMVVGALMALVGAFDLAMRLWALRK
ncbi:MAG: DUF4418 family protein [Coriobacteriales bacterium]|nr:DUF4418 family protein [Coriobacteriales bacterium]